MGHGVLALRVTVKFVDTSIQRKGGPPGFPRFGHRVREDSGLVSVRLFVDELKDSGSQDCNVASPTEVARP